MDAEELVESIIRGLMFLAGILGNNWLAIRSLPRTMSGIRTSEVLFINLAVSNLITNLLVDLPDTMADFAGRWFLGETYCGVFRFSADLSETSSIFTTFFISAFWHQKLVGSLKRGGAPVRMDSIRLVVCLLAAGWTVAVVFSVPHFFFVTVEGTNESEEDCVDFFPDAAAGQTYEILYLTLANALPLAGIVSVSVQIVITLLKNQQRIRSHKSEAPREAVKDSDAKTNDTRPAGPGPEGGPDPEAGPGPGNSSDPHVYTGVSASSGPNAPHHTPNHSSNKDGNHGDQPCPSKPPQMSSKPNPSSQVRAAKSVVAVASVFLVCWLTHLLLRITNNIHTSSLVVEVASYIAASYTCIIPYIFLYGVKKLSCSCKR